MAKNTTQGKGKFETFRTRNQFEYGYPIGLPFCLELNEKRKTNKGSKPKELWCYIGGRV